MLAMIALHKWPFYKNGGCSVRCKAWSGSCYSKNTYSTFYFFSLGCWIALG